MEQERLSKGIWIPIEIWKDKNLTWNEKILFLEIDSFTSADTDCFFSDEYISELLGISQTNANKTLASLIKKGYVIKTKFDGRRRYVKTALSYSTYQPCQERHTSRACDSNTDSKNSTEEVNKTTNKQLHIEEFVDRIYAKYPSKCPIRNISTGKTFKDKNRIKSLLKMYSMDEIERVVDKEIETKYGKFKMQNFSTFLNNFPDPNEMFSTQASRTDLESIVVTDAPNSYESYKWWVDRNMSDIWDRLRGGWPETEKQYQSIIDHTDGGAVTLCRILTVFNRDGWDEYYDERGFMWTYSNYIKANGLYKD